MISFTIGTKVRFTMDAKKQYASLGQTKSGEAEGVIIAVGDNGIGVPLYRIEFDDGTNRDIAHCHLEASHVPSFETIIAEVVYQRIVEMVEEESISLHGVTNDMVYNMAHEHLMEMAKEQAQDAAKDVMFEIRKLI